MSGPLASPAKSPVRALVDARRRLLMVRLARLEELDRREGIVTIASHELALIHEELTFLVRLLGALIAEDDERTAVSVVERALRALRGERFGPSTSDRIRD